MSKARGNVVNPDEIVAEYGTDSLRLYEMFMGPLEATKPWSMAGVNGMRNFLDRGWRLIVDLEGGSEQLFDLDADPGELRNVAAERPDKLATYRRELERFVQRAEQVATRYRLSPDLALSPGEVERLEQLGYAAGVEERIEDE